MREPTEIAPIAGEAAAASPSVVTAVAAPSATGAAPLTDEAAPAASPSVAADSVKVLPRRAVTTPDRRSKLALRALVPASTRLASKTTFCAAEAVVAVPFNEP